LRVPRSTSRACALRQYRQLTELIRGRSTPEAAALERIARHLLACWNAASGLTSTIPTRTGVQRLLPRFLWAEQPIVGCVERLLPTLPTKARMAAGHSNSGRLNEHISNLATGSSSANLGLSGRR
jgi:hypothetical protein